MFDALMRTNREPLENFLGLVLDFGMRLYCDHQGLGMAVKEKSNTAKLYSCTAGYTMV